MNGFIVLDNILSLRTLTYEQKQAIKELLIESSKTNWITDHLPDKTGQYMVTIEWPVQGSRYTDVQEFNKRIDKWADEDGFPENDEIVAWAPMPEPWEG